MATISHITLPDNTDYSIQATGILYGQVDSTSTSTVYTATIPGVTEYYNGLTIMLKNGIVTSAANFTININGLGAKGVYSNMGVGHGTTAATRETTIFNIDYSIMLIYSSTIVSGGGWIFYRGYCSDNTDTKQNITLATTSKAYITGVTTTPTSTAQALTGVADTGVYLTTVAGEISAARHSLNVSGTEKAYMVFNSTTNAIDFIFN